MTNYAPQFWLLALAGWINREQQDVIEYLQAENRVYREMLGERRLRFDDAQRRRLASRSKALSRGALANLGHQVGRSTVRRLLLENGLDPAPPRTTWASFLRSHWEQLAATDMFNVLLDADWRSAGSQNPLCPRRR